MHLLLSLIASVIQCPQLYLFLFQAPQVSCWLFLMLFPRHPSPPHPWLWSVYREIVQESRAVSLQSSVRLTSHCWIRQVIFWIWFDLCLWWGAGLVMQREIFRLPWYQASCGHSYLHRLVLTLTSVQGGLISHVWGSRAWLDVWAWLLLSKANKWQSWDLNPGKLDFQPGSLATELQSWVTISRMVGIRVFYFSCRRGMPSQWAGRTSIWSVNQWPQPEPGGIYRLKGTIRMKIIYSHKRNKITGLPWWSRG